MPVKTRSIDQTERCLERARAGDEQAFGELIAPYSRELHLHCYRMLGSLVDAEDLLQETLLAAWRGLDGFGGRSPLRAWLYRIATNRCLNAIRDSRRRGPPEPLPPFDPPVPSRRGEVTCLQPYPDAWLSQALDTAPGPAARYLARETIELAFIAALQRLPARQTAALLLSDVLGFSIAEVAGMLDTSATAVKGVLQRARASLARQDSGCAERVSAREERELAERFARAFTEDDIPGVIALLTDDAWLAMPPAPHEYVGRRAIAAFLEASATWRAGRHFTLEPTRANGQPAFCCYLGAPESAPIHPASAHPRSPHTTSTRTAQPESVHPESGQPGSARATSTGSAQPESAQPGSARATFTGSAQPESAQPGSARATSTGSAQPESAQPRSARPTSTGSAQPESAQPRSARATSTGSAQLPFRLAPSALAPGAQGRLTGVVVLTVRGGAISAIARFLDSDLGRFFRTAPSPPGPGRPA